MEHKFMTKPELEHEIDVLYQMLGWVKDKQKRNEICYKIECYQYRLDRLNAAGRYSEEESEEM